MKTLSIKNKTWVEGLALWCLCAYQVTGSTQHILPQQLTTDKQFIIVLYPILCFILHWSCLDLVSLFQLMTLNINKAFNTCVNN